jgi:serine/threonine protein kinase
MATRGLTLGNFVLLDRLGRGGRSRVFRGMHTTMTRGVALKVLPPGSTKCPIAVVRFQREVEASARLSHPNIVTALDAGKDKDVRHLVTVYIGGNDLASLVVEPIGHVTAKDFQATISLAAEIGFQEQERPHVRLSRAVILVTN